MSGQNIQNNPVELTSIFRRVQQGDAKAAEELLSSVYQELRRLAARKMADENSGHTLQPTALMTGGRSSRIARTFSARRPRRFHSTNSIFRVRQEAMTNCWR